MTNNAIIRNIAIIDGKMTTFSLYFGLGQGYSQGDFLSMLDYCAIWDYSIE
jgi:hypothetical protein